MLYLLMLKLFLLIYKRFEKLNNPLFEMNRTDFIISNCYWIMNDLYSR
ncbi:hypothetical protein GGR06_001005 [Bacteroides reticulotermitis]|uniref:Uncharacterized protein n=1 Tax=Bacteroides reticulotermitis TaxID=1133319 RepID=A0A840CYQ7_9BACE|nr:hypothetical protein [Bacteroides reticulotermitis]